MSSHSPTMERTDGSGDAVPTTGANNGDSNPVTTVVAVSSSSSNLPNATSIAFSTNSQATQIFTTPAGNQLAPGPIVSMSPNVTQQPIQVQVGGQTAYLQSPYYYPNGNQIYAAQYIAPQTLGSMSSLQLQLSGAGIPQIATAVSSPGKVTTSTVGKTAVSGNFTVTPTSTAQFAQHQFKNVAPALTRQVQQYPANTLIQLNPQFIPAAQVQQAASSQQAIASKAIAVDKKQNIVSALHPKPTAIMPNVTSQHSQHIIRSMPAQIIAPNQSFINPFQPFQVTQSPSNWLGLAQPNPPLILRPSEQQPIQYALHTSPQTLQTISVGGTPMQIAQSPISTGHLPPTVVSAMAAPTAIPTSATVTAASVSSSLPQTVNTPPSAPKLKPLAARPAAPTPAVVASNSNSNPSVTTVSNPNFSSTPNKSSNTVSLDSSKSSSTTNLLRSTKPTSLASKAVNSTNKSEPSSIQNSDSKINEHKLQPSNTSNLVKNNNVGSNKNHSVNKMTQETRSTGSDAPTKSNQVPSSKSNFTPDAKGGKDLHPRSSNDLRGTKRPLERKDVSVNHNASSPRELPMRNGMNKKVTSSPMQPSSKKNDFNVLVHVIENFVIEESTQPFPVGENVSSDSLVKENGNHKESNHMQNNNNNSNNNTSNTISTPVQTPKSEHLAASNGTKGKPVECSNCGPKNKSRIRPRGGKLCNNCSNKKSNGTGKLNLFNPVVGNLSEYDFNSGNEGEQSSRIESPITPSQPETKKAKVIGKKATSTPINSNSNNNNNETRALPPDNAAPISNNKSPQPNGAGVPKAAEGEFIPTSGKDPEKWKVSNPFIHIYFYAVLTLLFIPLLLGKRCCRFCQKLARM